MHLLPLRPALAGVVHAAIARASATIAKQQSYALLTVRLACMESLISELTCCR